MRPAVATAIAAITLAALPELRAQTHDALTTSSPAPAIEPSASSAPPVSAPQCREQRADPNMIRSNYIPIGGPPDVARHRRELEAASIRLRTERYGYFTGFGDPSWNAHAPGHYAIDARFMGLSIRVNRRIVPALACVEAEIRRSCSVHPYRPERLVGIRPANSYAGREVSNHVYGIAIDIDANRNPCCGCGTMYRNHPHCRRTVHSRFERMDMPECWVDAFERYGFYWLGHDSQLQDLMHFEFLGDPDRILERGSAL